MQFLDNESEILLQKCLENEVDYPKILRDELKACDNHIKESNLRSIIRLLVNEGFLSKISWGDNQPLFGRIEHKARVYFQQKDIYIRGILRNHPTFSLDEEIENALRTIIEIGKRETIFVINGSICSYQVAQELNKKGLIQFHGKPYGEGSNSFAVSSSLTQNGKMYFKNKGDYIDEIVLMHSSEKGTIIGTQFNIKNSPMQIGTVNSTQEVEYNFQLAQEMIDELLSKIQTIQTTEEKRKELLENALIAKELLNKKKKAPLKAILKGIYEIIKDIGCSVASGLIVAKMQGQI